MVIFAASNKFLDDIEPSECRRFEMELYPFIETNYSGLLKSLREKKAFDDAIKAEAMKALGDFKERFKASTQTAQAAEAAAAEKAKSAEKAGATA